MKVKTIKNPQASYNYTLGDKLVAGLVLQGFEVKSIRQRQVSLKNAFVSIKNNEAWLQNLKIFQQGADKTSRAQHKLLLTKSQIKSLQNALNQRYNTIVILRIILGKHIKIEIAPGLGKRKYDKRETIKQRESQRKIKRQIKGR